MFPIRVKTVQESDLRMLGSLARNIQRVLPVTQADIDAAAALGKGWVVWKVFEVSEPLDNMRGGTQLIIRQNSIQPGQNVRRVIFVVGPGGQTVVIRGTDYIVLPDAIANSLSYVKAFGGTEQNGTPTPDTPVDIVSNNGVLKARHQSGLPFGYTLLDYIESTGIQYIDTGIYPTDTTETMVVGQYTELSDNNSIFGALESNGRNYYGFGLANSGTEWRLWYGSGGRPWVIFGNSNTNKHTFLLKNKSLYIDNLDTPVAISDQSCETQAQSMFLFGVNLNNALYVPSKTKIFSAVIKNNNTLVRNFVPAKRNSDNVIGMYDTVSGQFFTNQGTGDFVAGNPVNDIEIYADGTVETINAHGKNLFDKNTALLGDVTTSGAYIYRTYRVVSDYIPVRFGQTFVGSGTLLDTNGVSYTAGIIKAFYKADKSYIAGSRGTPQDGDFTIDNNECAYIRVVFYNGSLTAGKTASIENSTLQLEEGETSTPYEPYYNGGTATAETLLKVGDYQDVQSIIDGVVTRNVGIYVFDGTESFVGHTTIDGFVYLAVTSIAENVFDGFCSHYARTDASTSNMPTNTFRFSKSGSNSRIVFRDETNASGTGATARDNFKSWLAAQYAAGTPVILVYPLKTPTTESVAGQTLQVTDGDNVLEITQASLTGLELEAQYNAAVSLTIQEVQDANLDNNVTVTIQ